MATCWRWRGSSRQTGLTQGFILASSALSGVGTGARKFDMVNSFSSLMLDNWLSNRVFKIDDDILDHCCQAWNDFVAQPERTDALGTQKYAKEF
ncbi:MAG: hypothetical protein OXC63_05665 [Aestuariivita sp.]|nr:hypothetical protein [Aestuariivita sp.]MCY4345829.1 hypothetical protein [Aestuariivita sp.]